MKKYEKPVTHDLSNLTPALGLCTSGNDDGGCTVTGSFAGGAAGCGPGDYALAPGNACHPGSVAFGNDGGTTCNSGGAVINYP
jgi:hypothetical protein